MNNNIYLNNIHRHIQDPQVRSLILKAIFKLYGVEERKDYMKE